MKIDNRNIHSLRQLAEAMDLITLPIYAINQADWVGIFSEK